MVFALASHGFRPVFLWFPPWVPVIAALGSYGRRPGSKWLSSMVTALGSYETCMLGFYATRMPGSYETRMLGFYADGMPGSYRIFLYFSPRVPIGTLGS